MALALAALKEAITFLGPSGRRSLDPPLRRLFSPNIQKIFISKSAKKFITREGKFVVLDLMVSSAEE